MMKSKETLDFMARRRSHPLVALQSPGPDRAALEELLTRAARVPDHGRMEPWRFILPGPARRAELSRMARAHGEAKGLEPEAIDKALRQFEISPCPVIVIASPKASEKIPECEQILTVGAVCLGLVNGALAAGWGAVWLSGWLAHDRAFAAPAYGLAEGEWVAGLIHIGQSQAQPPERPRPDLAAITEWHP